MIVVLRIAGKVNLRGDVVETLNRLRIRRKLACTLVDEKDKIKMGMVNSVKSHVSYDHISDDLVKKLIEKRGDTLDGKNINKKDVEKIFEEIKANKWKIKKFFRLHPPIGGFKKSTKEMFPVGILGHNKNLSKLLERML